MFSKFQFSFLANYNGLLPFFIDSRCVQGEKDWQKYETARRLKKCVDRLRAQYREDWKSKEMRIRQRAVALYFIDKVNISFSFQTWKV